MLAAFIEATGGPEVIQVRDVPTPPVSPGHVLVEAQAIGVGVPDLLIRSGAYPWMPPLPAILGIEMSGRVCEVGAGVDRLQEGTRVHVSARDLPARAGCYAEFICVPATSVTVLPDTVSYNDAVCLSNYQVAHGLLTYTSNPGTRSILVYGAAGGVGSAIVELGALRGYRVVAVASSARRGAFALEIGASAVVDRSSARFMEEVLETTGGGVDLVLDPAGGQDFHRNFELLNPFGTAVLYGMLAGNPPDATLRAMHSRLGRSPALRLFSMHSLDPSPEIRAEMRTYLVDLMAARKLKAPIHGVLPLARAKEAHELLSSGSVLGKLVLSPAAQ